MSKNNYAFPWGIYIGDLIDNNDTIPLCLDSKEGGFCLLFDDNSEKVANNFIENIALKLFEVLPLGRMEVNIFDFGKKRFMHLSALQSASLYNIAYSSNSATSKFNDIDEIALYRHHNILSFEFPTLSEYNQQSKNKERYHLLLVNLDDFPDDMTSKKTIKTFFDSAYKVGFYTIAFGSQEVLKSKSKATNYILEKFPRFDIRDKEIILNKSVFEFADMMEGFAFEYVNDNKDRIVKNLLSLLEKEEDNKSEKDFLSIPIGTSVNGKEEVSFTLGNKTKNYHAFITGATGTGKTNLINRIILGIAEQYTAKEVELYLMDYKLGTEFGVFERHPNCRKIFLDNEDLEASVTMLEEFVKSMNIREAKFKQDRVSDIDEYNKKNPEELMPRKILIIDEVQQLFDGSFGEQQHFNKLLEKVVRLGRSFGLHIILSTQSLVGVNVNEAIMLQIGLRVSFRLSKYNEATKIFNDRNIDDVLKLRKELFEFIYNADSGNREANVVGRAMFLDKDRIELEIARVINGRDEGDVLRAEVVRSVDKEKQKMYSDEKKEFVKLDVKKNHDGSSEKKGLDELLKKHNINPIEELR